MAKSTNAIAIILNLALMLALLHIFPVAESQFFGNGLSTLTPIHVPVCDQVYGVNSGDTCLDVAKNFNLPTDFFNSINPNLNCSALFIGQWLCVDGTVT
ncbi:hypothetical protein ACB092_05G264400 [Castanea dentata]